MRPLSVSTVWIFVALSQIVSASNSWGGKLDSSAIAETDVKTATQSVKKSVVSAPQRKWDHTMSTFQSPSIPPFSQSLVDDNLDFEALCAQHNGWVEHRNWQYWFKKARCVPTSGNPRLVMLTCRGVYRVINPSNQRLSRAYNGPDKTLYPECPVGTICQMVVKISQGLGGPQEEIGCVDPRDLVREIVRSDPEKSDQEVHCSLTLQLPGAHYRAAPGQQKIDLVLTEQVQFPNGSAYPAPLLYIRDISDPRNFDRALRRDTNVASAEVEIGVYKGRFLSKTFEFCMQILPGHAISSAIFTYSFFQVSSHHGRVSSNLS